MKLCSSSNYFAFWAVAGLLVAGSMNQSFACTTLLVGKKASADGSAHGGPEFHQGEQRERAVAFLKQTLAD